MSPISLLLFYKQALVPLPVPPLTLFSVILLFCGLDAATPSSQFPVLLLAGHAAACHCFLLLEILFHRGLGASLTLGSLPVSFLHWSAPIIYTSFLIYTSSLSGLIQPYGFKHHPSLTTHKLRCPAQTSPLNLVSISIWISNRRLKLNMFKIKLLIHLPKEYVPPTVFPIVANGNCLLPLVRVKTWEASWLFHFSCTLHYIRQKIFIVQKPSKSTQNLTTSHTSTAATRV